MIEGDKYKPKKNHVANATVPVESQLDRIERKLDALLATYYKV